MHESRMANQFQRVSGRGLSVFLVINRLNHKTDSKTKT
jgi:hypothetical protein